MRWVRFSVLLFALATAIYSPASNREPVTSSPANLTLDISRVDHPPRLEDYLEMAPGASAPAMTLVDNFTQHDPKDGAPAQEKTKVYVGYDTRNFYAVFVCFDRTAGKIRARMARREDIGPEHDQVQLYLDTFHDHRRSYGFMANPLGVQYDFIWTENGGYDSSWDTVWDSSGRVTAQGYIVLMSIPFKSLRFAPFRQQTWGILFQRVIPHDNENSFYPYVSASVQGRLSQEAELHGLFDIRPGHNLQLVPYGLLETFRNLDARDPSHPFFTAKDLGGRAGLDGKYILKDSLVLDFTVNPDFRQLESDQPQNTVNQRFEVFFPEKRPFFQEGANYFDTPINMYFTRRIINPQFGVRLTGKIGPYGIGLLAVDDRGLGQTVPDSDPLHGKRAYFTVGRITRELSRQSQVGLFFSDREMDAVPNSLCSSNAISTTEQIACVSNSNRVGGADFTLHLGNHFQTQAQALTSVTDQVGGMHLSGNLFASYTEYSSRHVEFTSNLRDISSGFVTLTGFFQQPDIRRMRNLFTYLFKPEGPQVVSWGPHIFQALTYDHQGNRLDALVEPGMEVHLRQNTDIFFYAGHWNELLRPSDYPVLPHNVDFDKRGYWGLNGTTSYLKWITLSAGYFSGHNLNYDPPAHQAPFLARETQFNLSATLRPLNALTFTNDYILERLRTETDPARAIVNGHVIRSKINYQYNKRLSFRTILQYNALLADPLYTDLERTKNFNADFLITYLIHPGTAFYFGYNSNLENLDPDAISAHMGLVRSNRSLVNDGRTIYAKISYLFRF